ncbi:hypothetical protein BG28_04795 [Nesterenkonia sp. AN1]|nr:hypothetical protein BG28_04795 [Nesterenkonia sp. AN1]
MILRPVSTLPPWDSSSATSARTTAPEPPRATGQPLTCAAAPSSSPNAEVKGLRRSVVACAASPAKSAFAGAWAKICCNQVEGQAPRTPICARDCSRRAALSDCRLDHGAVIGVIPARSTWSQSRATGPKTLVQAAPSGPSPSAVARTEECSRAGAAPSSRPWAAGIGGCRYSRPCRARPGTGGGPKGNTLAPRSLITPSPPGTAPPEPTAPSSPANSSAERIAPPGASAAS